MIKFFLGFFSKYSEKARLKALSDASHFLYQQQNPYIPYRIISLLIREGSISLSRDLFFFINKEWSQSLKALIKQQLITTSPYLVQQCILYHHQPKISLSFYFPKKFLFFLSNNGVNVNKLHSKIIFTKRILGKYVEGLKCFYELILNSSVNAEEYEGAFCSLHGTFDALLPRHERYTFLNWLDQESPLKGKFSSYRFLASNVENKSIDFKKNIHFSNSLFDGLSAKNRIIFISKAFCLLALAGVLLIAGRWQLAFLSKEILQYMYFELLPCDKKAKCYLFFCHDLGFRPLWTYQAQQENRDVINVFYASSYTLFTYSDISVPSDIKLPYVQISSWPHYWVQSNHFKKILTELIEMPAKIDAVGAFPLTDCATTAPLLGDNEILVFDVDSSSDFLEYSKHGYIIPNYTDDIVIKFWADLSVIASELNVRLVHKRKRNDPIDSIKYKKLLSDLEKNPKTYKIISGDINTFELIHKNKNIRIISIPFTSTGELSVLLGAKRSIFYNAINNIADEEKHAREVPVITGLQNLRKWLHSELAS